MAQAIKQVITTEPEFHQQVHLMYFNNLDAPLPSALRNSFEDLFNAFCGLAARLRVAAVFVVVQPALDGGPDDPGASLVGVLGLAEPPT